MKFKRSGIMEPAKTSKATNCNNEKVQNLDLTVSNLVLTPLTCASLIGEILKCLIYEKSQIPYPYNWLKNIILTKRKQSSESEETGSKSLFIEKQYRAASAAFDTVEDIISNIRKLFKFGNSISEIIVLLGATPLSPKEVYKFNIPKLATGHIECNHHSTRIKFQHNILRSLFMSEEWMCKMEQSLPLTNLHAFVKMTEDKSVVIDNSTLDFFIPSSSFAQPKSAHCLTVNFLHDDSVVHNCCSNLTVYEDKIINDIMDKEYCDVSDKEENSDHSVDDVFEIDTTCLQANSVLKGFRQGSVNNVAVSNLW